MKGSMLRTGLCSSDFKSWSYAGFHTAGWVCTSMQLMAGRTAGLCWKHIVKQLPSARLSCCSPGVQVFEKFLAGDTLQDCYAAVAAVANRWLDMLDTQVRVKQP